MAQLHLVRRLRTSSMNARPFILRKHSLRVLVAISLPLALFWSLGLAADLGWGFDPPPAILLAVSVFSAWGFLWLACRLHRHFLSLPVEPSTRAILIWLAVSSVGSYCVGALMLFELGSVAIWLSHTQNREASLLVALASLWLPLWFTPPAASLATWFRFRHAFTADNKVA